MFKLGMPEWQAYQWGNTRKGYWRTTNSPILARALNKSLLKREGYLSLAELSTLPTVLFWCAAAYGTVRTVAGGDR